MQPQSFERPRAFYDRFERKGGDQTVTHYCPGCGHGNIHKYVAEAIEDFGVADRTVFVNPVGCSVFAYYYLDTGHVQAAHGRAPAVATAIKRARPGSIVISYQGDGDLAAIGGNEIVQAANRGENITVIFINNALYGMTGGQMAPTTLIGQKTTTTPSGRTSAQEGYPIRVCELLNGLQAPASIERVALGDAKHDMAARKAIRRAIRNQIEGRGFSLVEVLSPCPTGWKLTPPESVRFVLDTMTDTFPLGRVRETGPNGDDVETRPVGLRETVDPNDVPDLLGIESPEGEDTPALVAPETPLDAEPGPPAAPWTGAAPDLPDALRNPRIKAAGFGGQGVLFLGTLLAEAAMHTGRAVSWLPSYGPEMRGGTAHCHVTLAETEVDSPLVTRSTVLFAFNRPSLERFGPEVEKGGLVIYDSSLIPDPPSLAGVEMIGVPASEIADRLGSTRSANMVALGVFLARTRLLPPSIVEHTLRLHKMDPAVIERNMKALEEGLRITHGSPMGSATEKARRSP